LMAGWDSGAVRELAPRAFCPAESFGIEEGERWQAYDIDFGGEMTSFTVRLEGREFGRYLTPLAGLFNVRNCLGVIAACEGLGFGRRQGAGVMGDFENVKR